MRNFVKILFCFLLTVISSDLKPQQTSISGLIKGGEGKKIILSRVYGGQEFAIDSVVLKPGGDFVFIIKGPFSGLCRISFPDSVYIDVVVNHENIVFSCSADAPESTINIVQSAENTVYYSFLRSVSVLDDSIRILTGKGQMLYESDPVANKTELQKLATRIEKFSASRKELALSVANSNPALFASKIIKASVTPDFNTYLQNEKNPVFKKEFDFLKYHYLDNIDFTDSAMLNTPVIYERCGEYIRNFANPPSVKAYKQLIDIMMGKVSANEAIKEYILELLLKTFDSPSWEDIYVYVADNYFLSGTCGSVVDSADVSERSMLIKKLKPGNVAPDFSIKTDKGATIRLSEIKSKYTLVFFWASWCEFCEEAMPEIKKIFNDYKAKSFEIIAVSADTTAKNWNEASSKNAITWINTCDLQGFKSPVLKAYNVVRTPNIFLMDENKIILGHFYNAPALRKKLETLSWEQK
jgi:peroxiredoxin